VEPAVHCLFVAHSQPDDFWSRLRDVLDAQGSPRIEFRHDNGTVTFESDTGDFMLRARVADALMTVCEHDD
jgi:hypothetical protein